MFWSYYCGGYIFISLLMTTTCFYYQLRLRQLDYYVKMLLTIKNQIRIDEMLNEYSEIMNEVNQFNKFACK